MLKGTTGLVLGKFMPLHRGHELLLKFAARFVNRLLVVVDNIPDAPIEAQIRCQWIQETIPQVEIFYIPEPQPQHPHEQEDFWEIWRKCLLSLLPVKPDYVFASETYGFKLSEVMGAKFIPFDLKRENVPVSATMIRNNPLQHWDYLAEVVKPFYLKRICLFGPESTGKTTLSKELAAQFNTIAVPEYARLFIETKKEVSFEDMEHIAKGQIALEDSLAPYAKKLLFCDTNPLATTIWSRWLFGECTEKVTQLARCRHYDLYLLTAPDLDWQPDAVRYFPDKKEAFFEDCEKALKMQGCHYRKIEGRGPKRLEKAIEAVNSILPKPID